MSAHLTIAMTPATGAKAATPAQANAADESPLGAFGALLDAMAGLVGGGDGATTTGQSSSTELSASVGGLGSLELQVDDEDDGTASADAANPLGALMGALLGIEQAVSGGQPVSAELRQQLGDAADKLTTLIEGLGGSKGAAQGGHNNQLADKLGELAQNFAAEDPALAQKLQTLGKAIESSGIGSKALLQLAGDAAPELAAQLKSLIGGAGKAETSVPEAPKLGTPKLDPPHQAGEVKGSKPAGKHDAETVLAKSEGKADKLDAKLEAKAHERMAATDAPKLDTPTPASTPGAASDVAAAQQSLTQNKINAAPHLRPAHNAYAAQGTPDLPQIAVEVARHVGAGSSQFQIRLDPPELGRIDVKLEVDPSGAVTTRMTVEKVETLDLLQRDQRGLEKALAQAGLDSSKTSLEFSLRQNPFARQDQGGREAPLPFGQLGESEAEAPAPAPSIIYRGALARSGLNLVV